LTVLLVHANARGAVRGRTGHAGALPPGRRALRHLRPERARTNPPTWYHNLKANPAARVEVGRGTAPVLANEITGQERDRLWDERRDGNLRRGTKSQDQIQLR
jgi:hypothetical protein